MGGLKTHGRLTEVRQRTPIGGSAMGLLRLGIDIPYSAYRNGEPGVSDYKAGNPLPGHSPLRQGPRWMDKTFGWEKSKKGLKVKQK